jgi:hypothetical protein
MIGECGFDHTFYEPSMPGYRATIHNAMWAGFANGLAAAPFWWAYGSYINGNVVTESMRHFAQFVKGIPFTSGEYQPVAVEVSNGDGWAMRGEEMTFGWAVRTTNSIAGETLTVTGLKDGVYEVYLYRPWRGVYLAPVTVLASGGRLSVTVPELKPVASRTQNVGNDVAFKIVQRGVAVEVE